MFDRLEIPRKSKQADSSHNFVGIRWTNGSDIKSTSTPNSKLLGKKPAVFDWLGRLFIL